MNLLVGQLKNAIRDLLDRKKIDASVVDKVNARGELVIAVVMNEVCPACNGTGKKHYAPRDDDDSSRSTLPLTDG